MFTGSRAEQSNISIKFFEAFSHLKPLIQIDDTRLSVKDKHTLLIVISQDGNRRVVPLAFAIVEGEKREMWSWFLIILCEYIVRGRTGVSLILDKGLYPVCHSGSAGVPPFAQHFTCIRHLYSNIIQLHKDKDATKLVQRKKAGVGWPINSLICRMMLTIRCYSTIHGHIS